MMRTVMRKHGTSRAMIFLELTVDRPVMRPICRASWRTRAAPHGGTVIPPAMEQTMKLTSAQVAQALTQLEASVVPDDHPMITKLNGIFGEHTYFLDAAGLTIIEPPSSDGSGRTDC